MSRQLYLDNNCNVANSGSCCVVRVDDEPLVWCPGRPRSLEEGFVCLPQVLFGTLLVEPGCEVGHPQPTTVNSTTCPQIFKIFPARMLLRTFQYPSHSNKLKPEAQQTTVRKVKSRAQQVPNCTRSNCPGEPSPLIPPKVQSPASSPESGYLLVCPFFSVRSCMEYIPLRHGVTPAAQTPEHAERGAAVDVPLPAVPEPSLCRASIGKSSQSLRSTDPSRCGCGRPQLGGLAMAGNSSTITNSLLAAAAVFACLQLHLPCITIHRSPPPPPPPSSCCPPCSNSISHVPNGPVPV
ncbi:uncharacterized protein CCOS01_00596 [Colletotrichum costaricense]|uniref:Uncharacterized protein n=1 Tax=Colletotrichum costaricense TaxID=1209916 RepID=A0AAJ0E685_9PEZI|nr:uncharacterized protein CCOS01_00596 [Colletotrichum costaricense]KAK1539282.1 hypothetical protein CCOS01_00596 [Colletotrichum costaricense]